MVRWRHTDVHMYTCTYMRSFDIINTMQQMYVSIHFNFTSSPILISAPPSIRTPNVWIWFPIVAIIAAVLPCCIVIRCHWERVNCSNNIIDTVLQCIISQLGAHTCTYLHQMHVETYMNTIQYYMPLTYKQQSQYTSKDARKSHSVPYVGICFVL